MLKLKTKIFVMFLAFMIKGFWKQSGSEYYTETENNNIYDPGVLIKAFSKERFSLNVLLSLKWGAALYFICIFKNN